MKNLKALALVAVMIFSAFGASAQCKIGVRVGMNVNNFDYQGDLAKNFDVSNRAGLTAGLTSEFMIPILGLGFDVSALYTRMNSEINGINWEAPGMADLDKLIDGDMSQDFIEVPVNLKYKLGIPVIGNLAKPMIFTGPTFAFKISGDDNVVETKKVQAGWNIGGGVELFNCVQVSASYCLGLNDAINQSNALKNFLDQLPGDITDQKYGDGIKAKNNYWTITAAILF